MKKKKRIGYDENGNPIGYVDGPSIFKYIFDETMTIDEAMERGMEEAREEVFKEESNKR